MSDTPPQVPNPDDSEYQHLALISALLKIFGSDGRADVTLKSGCGDRAHGRARDGMTDAASPAGVLNTRYRANRRKSTEFANLYQMWTGRADNLTLS